MTSTMTAMKEDQRVMFFDPLDYVSAPQQEITNSELRITNLEEIGIFLLPLSLQLDHLITEDDTPVDNFFSEKQQRLLTEPLYSSWSGPGNNRPFIVAANVGVFYSVYEPAIVPDIFLSLDVRMAKDWWETRGRSYFIWEHGKPPDVVIEIVSNKKGYETTTKMYDYANMGVTYYVIFDPKCQVQSSLLTLHELSPRGGYVKTKSSPEIKKKGRMIVNNQIIQPNGGKPKLAWWLDEVNLGLTLWKDLHEGHEKIWLRWCDQNGEVIPSGIERAKQEQHEKEIAWQHAEQERHEKEIALQRAEQQRQRAEQQHQRAEQQRHEKEIALQRVEQERQRAEQERHEKESALQRAEQERQRNERLMAQLQALGINPQL